MSACCGCFWVCFGFFWGFWAGFGEGGIQRFGEVEVGERELEGGARGGRGGCPPAASYEKKQAAAPHAGGRRAAERASSRFSLLSSSSAFTSSTATCWRSESMRRERERESSERGEGAARTRKSGREGRGAAADGGPHARSGETGAQSGRARRRRRAQRAAWQRRKRRAVRPERAAAAAAAAAASPQRRPRAAPHRCAKCGGGGNEWAGAAPGGRAGGEERQVACESRANSNQQTALETRPRAAPRAPSAAAAPAAWRAPAWLLVWRGEGRERRAGGAGRRGKQRNSGRSWASLFRTRDPQGQQMHCLLRLPSARARVCACCVDGAGSGGWWKERPSLFPTSSVSSQRAQREASTHPTPNTATP